MKSPLGGSGASGNGLQQSEIWWPLGGRVHQGHKTATVVNNTGQLGGSADIGTAIELLLSMIMNDGMVQVRDPILL